MIKIYNLHIRLTITILLLTLSYLVVAQSDEYISDLEQKIIEMGATFDLDSTPDAHNLNEYIPPELQQQDYPFYQEHIANTEYYNNQNLSDFQQVSSDELIYISQLFKHNDMQSLYEQSLFNGQINGQLDGEFQCNTYIPKLLLSASEQLDSSTNLSEQINSILLSQNSDNYLTMEDVLGSNWEIDTDIEQGEDTNDTSSENYYINSWLEDTFEIYQQQENTNYINFEAPPIMFNHYEDTLMIRKPIPRDRFNSAADYLNLICQKLEASGVDSTAWLSYEKHNEFTIKYRLCGADGISSDIKERVLHKVYLMPNWSMVNLEKCTKFTSNCAPMHIQMIAADILYERRIFQNEGFKTPNHWNVEVLSNYYKLGSSAYGGTIKLNGPAQHPRGMRSLIFHEYFHAIQAQYGSEGEWWGNGEMFGRYPSIKENTAWWAQLESLADWAPYAINFGINPWPSYFKNHFVIGDARNHFFKSSYHPLEYGYLAERFSSKGNDKISSCLGCDSIKQYLEILNGESNGQKQWKSSFNAVYSFIEKMKNNSIPNSIDEVKKTFVLNQFFQDYHLDLLFSILDKKWATTSGNFKFFNRQAPLISNIFPTRIAWPPAIHSVPAKPMTYKFGKCTSKNSNISRSKASQIGAQYIYGFTCDIRTTPSGAIYLEVPLDKNNLPDELMITGVGIKLHKDDINILEPTVIGENYRIIPGELINGNLRIFSVPTLNSQARTLYANRAIDSSYKISIKNNHPIIDRIYLVIDYPSTSIEWLKLTNSSDSQRENFMARIGVVAYWNN